MDGGREGQSGGGEAGIRDGHTLGRRRAVGAGDRGRVGRDRDHYEAGVGVNWAIWVTVLAGALAWSATRKGRRLDPVALWAIGLAVLVGWGSAVTDNGLFQALIIVSCGALLATAARIAAGVPGNRVGAAQMLGAPVLTSVFSIFETGRRVVDGAGAVSGGRNRPIVRGVAIAVPIAAVFAMTLAGADPVLAHWRTEILLWVQNITFVPTLVTFVCLLVVALGTFGMAVRGSFGGSETLAFEGPSSWPIGQSERSMHHRRRGDRVRGISRPAADIPLPQCRRTPREWYELHGVRAPGIRGADRRGDTVRTPDPGAGPPHAA